MKKKVSIIYSFRNEKDNIKELVRRSISSLKETDCDYEIIFVNDRSDDGSREIIESLIKDNSAIKLINNSSRFGQAQSTLAGMRYASGDAVIYLDSDLQDPPEIFPALINMWKNGYEVVHTKRTKRRGESFLKMQLTKLAYYLINKLSFIQIPINCGDYKLIDKVVVKNLIENTEEEPYLRSLISWIGYKQGFLEYERDPRNAGRTHFPLLGLNPFETFFIGLTSFSVFPLYIPLIITILSIISLTAYSTLSMYKNGSLSEFNYIIITIHIFASLTMASISIIGVYLARVHMQTRGRKQYIIESTVGLSNEE